MEKIPVEQRNSVPGKEQVPEFRLSGEGDRGLGKEFVIWWQKSIEIVCCSHLWEVIVKHQTGAEKCSHVFAHSLGQLGLQPRKSQENWMEVSKHKIIKNRESRR